MWPGQGYPLPPEAILPTIDRPREMESVPGFQELHMPDFKGLVDDGRMDALHGLSERMMDIQLEREGQWPQPLDGAGEVVAWKWKNLKNRLSA